MSEKDIKRRITNYVADHRGFRKDGAKQLVSEFEQVVCQSQLQKIIKQVQEIYEDAIEWSDFDVAYFDFHKGRKEVAEQILSILKQHKARVCPL